MQGRFQLLSVCCYGGRGRIPRISTRSLALSALGPCTLLLRTFVSGNHLPRRPRVSLRLLLEECYSVRYGCARAVRTCFAQYLVRQWTYVPGLFSLAFGRISGIFFVKGSSDPTVDSRLALPCRSGHAHRRQRQLHVLYCFLLVLTHLTLSSVDCRQVCIGSCCMEKCAQSMLGLP